MTTPPNPATTKWVPLWSLNDQNIPKIALVDFPPANPYDGMLVHLAIATPTNTSAIWTLRFNAALAVGRQWEVVGACAPIRANISTPEQIVGNVATGSVSWAACSTDFPSITVPRAGDYDIEFGAEIEGQFGTGFNILYIRPLVNGTASGNMAYASVNATAKGGADHQSLARTDRILGLGTGAVVKLGYSQQNALATPSRFANRWLNVRPFRIG